MDNQFNYCIGRYWVGDSGAVAFYTCHDQIHWGTIEDARGFLEYVSSVSPGKDWKIFTVGELNAQV